MSIVIRNDRCVKIIDKTVDNLIRRSKNVNLEHVKEIMQKLIYIGVDFFEFSKKSFLLVINAIEDYNRCLIRVNSISDLSLCKTGVIKNIVLNADRAKFNKLLNMTENMDLHVTIEYNINTLDELTQLIDSLKIYNIKNVKSIRISGMTHFENPDWVYAIERIKEYKFNNIEICPYNDTCLATSIAVEGIMKAADAIICAFMGTDKRINLGALEEIMAYAIFIVNRQSNKSLKEFQSIKKTLNHYMHFNNLKSKPIVGDEIFYVESGIHVDGISKNPITYEPFEPNMVGLERKIYIGKHSGKKALMEKIKNMNIDVKLINIEGLLDYVKEKSYMLQRSFNDDELVDIIEEFKKEFRGVEL